MKEKNFITDRIFFQFITGLNNGNTAANCITKKNLDFMILDFMIHKKKFFFFIYKTCDLMEGGWGGII